MKLNQDISVINFDMTQGKDPRRINMDDFLKVNLTMFDDGTQMSTGTSPTTATPEGSNPVNSPQAVKYEPKQNKSSQNLSNVVYGKQETATEPTPPTTTEPKADSTPNAQGETTQVTLEDRKALYKQFKEQYKDLYGAEVESIIKERFKKFNGLEQQLGQYSPIVNLLMERHGAKDPNELYSKISQEVYETIADRDGLTVEQVREIETLKLENARLREKTQTVEQETAMNQRIADWKSQADTMKTEYPDFNIDEWASNEQFMNLLFAGVNVKSAYEVCNISGIKANVAKQMEKNVVSNIQAKGQTKIKENGLNPSAGMTIKASVKDLTKEDRAEIARRARMGETITF